MGSLVIVSKSESKTNRI